MRSINQNVANKRSYKTVSITGAIIIALAIVILSAMLLSVGQTSVYADNNASITYTSEELTSTYNQQVFSKTSNILTSEVLGKSWLNENQVAYDYFEYVIEFRFDTTVPSYDAGNYYSNVNFNHEIRFGTYYSNELRDIRLGLDIGWGEYGKSISASDYDNTYFLTIASDRASFSYYNFYMMPSYIDGNFTEYSYSRELVSYPLGSQEYSALYNCFFSSSEIFYGFECMNLDGYSVAGDKTLTETLRLYKTMEAPEKVGYTFTGWYYDKDCTQPYKGEQIFDDVKLYAGWKINTYTVYFDGSGLVDPEDPNTQGLYDWITTVEYGSVPEYNPEIDLLKLQGVRFGGWYFEDGTKYENTPVVEDMHLYGKFICTISFDVNGGNSELEPIEVEYGSKISVPIPERDGYGFSRWFYYNDIMLDGQNFTQILVFENSTIVKSDITLIADWYRNVFTVTFYVDDVVWKQVDVRLGETLGSVAEEFAIDKSMVKSYFNENINTQASAFADFVVEDDVSVYLFETTIDNSTSASKLSSFADSIKSFFKRIGDWFKNLFSKIKRGNK